MTLRLLRHTKKTKRDSIILRSSSVRKIFILIVTVLFVQWLCLLWFGYSPPNNLRDNDNQSPPHHAGLNRFKEQQKSTIATNKTRQHRQRHPLSGFDLKEIIGPSSSPPSSTSSVAEDPSSSISILYSILQDTMTEHAAQDAYNVDTIEREAENNNRCVRYGFRYDNSTAITDATKHSRRTNRRIFMGALLADDSWHALFLHAMESYGLYHSVTFVESNRTQQWIPRTLRKASDVNFLKNSGMFGPQASVYYEYFFNEDGRNRKSRHMQTEHKQRSHILKAWKDQGMTTNDIGLMIDADETFTRDFLIAAQTCEIDIWMSTPEQPQTCRAPVLRASGIIFEGSPQCVQKGSTKNMPSFRRWYHPAMIIGDCIDGIGDFKLHPPPERQAGQPYTARVKGYGLHYDWSNWPENATMYPLFNGADFRQLANGVVTWRTGYHFHNFFDTLDKVRWKHFTYGHKHGGALEQPLNAINRDVNLLVRCIMDRPDDDNYQKRLRNPIIEMKKDNFALPIAFRSKEYAQARKQELQILISKDEMMYGRADYYTGNNLYNATTMITHPAANATSALFVT